MAKYLMGIDRGSTNIKVAVYALDGTELKIASQPCETIRQLHPGWAEQDMELLWKNTIQAIHDVFEGAPFTPGEIAAIGFSGHGGGLYTVDADGRPARAAILSLDTRVELDYQQRRHNGEELPPLDNPADPARLMGWIKRYEPDVYHKIRWILQAKDWIRFCMTRQACVERSDFAMSGFVDDNTLEYDLTRCDALDISETVSMLPPLKNSWDVCGHVCQQAAQVTGLPEGIPCVAGGHDCALGSFGVGGFETGHLTAVLGTFAMNMLMGTNIPKADQIEDRALLSVVPDKWMCVNNSLTGRGLDWFIQNFCPYEMQLAKEQGTSVHKLLEQLAADANESADVVYHPFILPAAGKLFDSARVGLYGANMFTTRKEIIHAVFEGIAFAELYMLQKLMEEYPVKTLTLTGGGSNNDRWGQIFADMLGVPVEVPDIKEAGCRGAALEAGVGTGLIADHRTASHLPMKLKKRYTPNPDGRKQLQPKYDRFLKLAEYNQPYWKSLI